MLAIWGNRTTYWLLALLLISALLQPDVIAQTDQLTNTDADTEDINWATLTRSDLIWAHQQMLENHPGPVDNANPGFLSVAEAALSNALSLAENVSDLQGYHAVLSAYSAAFRDGHFVTTAIFEQPATLSWTGIILAWREPQGFIVAQAAPAEKQLVGSTLVSCDGIDADDLMLQRVFAFSTGKPDQPAYWFREAFNLLLDRGNPFAPLPMSCIFKEADETLLTHPLNWRPIIDEESDSINSRILVNGEGSIRTGMREIRPGFFWFNLPEFSPNETETGELYALFQDMNSRQTEIRNADILVIDVRNNNGGNSSWGEDFANALWGENYIDSLGIRSVNVIDWRATPGNLDHMNYLIEILLSQDRQDQVENLVEPIRDGMATALENGDTFYRETDVPQGELQSEVPSSQIENPVRAKVYFLNSGFCASSCLTFASQILHMPGVKHVGYPTSSDTNYLDIRIVTLPSGHGQMAIPIKVYRESLLPGGEFLDPEYRYDGLDWSTS